MQICPCCKRTMPRQKSDGRSKELLKDLSKAEYSIHCLESALNWPNESESFREAVQMELQRMNRAVTDHDLLFRIYRRSSKSTYYAIPERIEVAA